MIISTMIILLLAVAPRRADRSAGGCEGLPGLPAPPLCKMTRDTVTTVVFRISLAHWWLRSKCKSLRCHLTMASSAIRGAAGRCCTAAWQVIGSSTVAAAGPCGGARQAAAVRGLGGDLRVPARIVLVRVAVVVPLRTSTEEHMSTRTGRR